ncbi:hypothetical protein CC2G_000167 [Coprinopsis cinerea AmutBmut pab1-1]|nr:hypothetical protein CC2G_000167 [Coprinopsis cinerea AmutBmut pab1-1]
MASRMTYYSLSSSWSAFAESQVSEAGVLPWSQNSKNATAHVYHRSIALGGDPSGIEVNSQSIDGWLYS